MRVLLLLNICAITIIMNTGSPLLYAQEDLLPRKIAALLKESYDHKKTDSAGERFLLVMGRRNYFRMLDLWAETYPHLDTLPYTPDPSVLWLKKRMQNELNEEELSNFEGYFIEIQHLTLANFTMYLEAIKTYALSDGEYSTLSCAEIDSCLAHEYFTNMQKELYRKEERITGQIESVLSDERVAAKLVIERSLFNFIIAMRKKTIERLLAERSGTENSSREACADRQPTLTRK